MQNENENKKKAQTELEKNADESGYKLAKLIRQGNRELERQLNIKKTGGK